VGNPTRSTVGAGGFCPIRTIAIAVVMAEIRLTRLKMCMEIS